MTLQQQRLSPVMGAFAEALALARREGRLIDEAPPLSGRAEAMSVQAQALAANAEGRAGWKVAIHPVQGPVAAPLPSGLTRPGGSAFVLPQDVSVEIEIAVRLARDLPEGEHSRRAVADAVDGMCLGVELVGTRLAGGSDPFLPFLADSLANVAYVVGTMREPVEDEPAGRPCRAALDGVVFFDGPTELGHGDPLQVLVDALRVPGVVPGGFRAGEIVTTGSRCGVLKPPGQAGLLRCSIEGWGMVEARLSPRA